MGAADQLSYRCYLGDTRPRLANWGERTCVRLFEANGLRWLYEPRTFPLRWDDQGRVTEAVTPDFYLVDLDLYLEITTMHQAHVTRKARKIRRLVEAYPEIRARLWVRRDIERIAERYGVELERAA